MRRNKNSYMLLIIVLMIGITIGYAALNSTLNIIGKSSISKNTWDVHFDNIKVKNKSIEAVKTPVIENNTNINFEVSLNLPGDFYEFTVDVVNGGTIDAMIESINKTPDLSTEQQKYLNYTVSYENGKEIVSKQLVNKESFVRLKVRVEYKSDITVSDLPNVSETLNLGFNINYVQADGSGIFVKNNGESLVTAAGDVNEIGTVVTIGTEQFYTIGTEGNNVKLLSKYNLYVGEECTYDFETDTSICTAYENATGMQDENMTGIYYWDAPSTGVVKFSDVSVNYSGSIVEEHVNNYKNLLKENFGLNVKEARILNYDELSNTETFNCLGYGLCSDRYPWIYSTSYWTDYAYSDTGVWCIMSNGNSVHSSYNVEGSDFGVRPVIIVSKDIFE